MITNLCFLKFNADFLILPKQGGGLCLFTFKPDLPSDITSGTAKFADLGSVDLNGVKNKTNCLFGKGIPRK